MSAGREATMQRRQYVMPFHSVDPVDRVASRCDERPCTRAVDHPGPHRSVQWDGAGHIISDTFWWSP